MHFPLVAAGLVAAALSIPEAAAQCGLRQLGRGCGSTGMHLLCTAPQIGQPWSIGAQRGDLCGSRPIPILTMLGPCVVPGIPINQPLTCATCPSCELNVVPAVLVLQWSWPAQFSVRLPNDPGLVGVQFCVQNACVDVTSPCVCLSAAAEVRVIA